MQMFLSVRALLFPSSRFYPAKESIFFVIRRLFQSRKNQLLRLIKYTQISQFDTILQLLENITNERKINMKKILILLSAIALALVCVFSVSAEEAEQAPYIFWDKEPYVENETTKIIDHVVYRLCYDYRSKEYHYDVYDWFDTQEAAATVEEINIVPEIDGIKVIGIQCQATYDEQFNDIEHSYYKNHNYSVKKVTLPDSIDMIGSAFFSALDGLEELILPANIVVSGDRDFYDMESLREVTFSSGDIVYLGGFKNCPKLEKVNYTGTIKAIGTEAFRNCTSLTYFEIPETVETIYDAAFRGSGITSVTIPANTRLYDYDYGYTFTDCVNLTKVTFSGEYYRYVGMPYKCFAGCTALKKVTFPMATRGVELSTGAFYGCTSLEEIVFPETCGDLFLDWEVFKGCTSLKKVELPYKCGMIDIGKAAFKNCTALEEIVSPFVCGNVAIRQQAFRGCTSLKALNFPKFYCGTVTIFDDAFRGCTALETIKFTPPDQYFTSDKIYTGNIIIGKRAFRGCTALTTIKNTANVEKIYGGAFRDCTSLTYFNLSDKIQFIGINAFYGCKNLKYLNLKATKNSPKIYAGAFYGTASDILFTTNSNSTAKALKSSLIKSGFKAPKVRAKIYV